MQRRDVLDATVPGTTVDPDEIARFEALAEAWWDPDGRFKAMHRFNPVRRDYLLAAAAAHFDGGSSPTPLAGRTVLDIGCGGGLLCEPFAEQGAAVTGIDATGRNIEAARRHAAASGLDIEYQHTLAGDLAASGRQFDLVINTEVVEHVVDLETFLAETAALVAPGGLLFVATINRTWRAWLAAIVVAEYIAGLLPRGTHSYDKFVRPGELDASLTAAGLERVAATGMSFNPITRRWRLGRDLSVNYTLTYRRPA